MHLSMATKKKSRLKRPRNAMPAWIRRALASRGLMEAYRARPPYQRNDYVGWITRAKLPGTQTRRLEKMLEELAQSTHYMNMRWRAPRDSALLEVAVQRSRRAQFQTIEQYISTCAPEVQTILRKIREVVRRAAPDAEEGISYRMAAFKLNGPLVYFAAFTNHIGFYPPVRGDTRLLQAVSLYAGEKGNLRLASHRTFPLDRPIPYVLIARITKFRVRQNLAKVQGRLLKKQA
jgi:uncharacterized protein YdhG (YjbR/CyaY superfamily)